MPRFLALPVVAMIGVAVACTRAPATPVVPSITGVAVPHAQSAVAVPPVMCSPESASSNIVLQVIGEGFVASPAVSLVGPVSVTLSSSSVTYAGARLLLVDLSAEIANGGGPLPSGVYALKVSNPDGQSATFPEAFKIARPPTIAGVTAPDGLFVAGESTVIIAGDGFPADPSIDVRLASKTQGTAAVSVRHISPDQLTAAVTGLSEGSYDLTVTTADGCTVTAPQALNVVFGKLGDVTVEPRSASSLRNAEVRIFNYGDGTSMGGQPFSAGAPTAWIRAPLKKDPSKLVDIPLRREAFISPMYMSAEIPTCSGMSAQPVEGADCPDGIAPGGPYDIIVQDALGPTRRVGAVWGFYVVDGPLPVITELSPTELTTSGIPEGSAQPFVVRGANFGPNPKLQLMRSYLSPGSSALCDLPVSSASPTEVKGFIPPVLPRQSCHSASSDISLSPGPYAIRVAQNDAVYADAPGPVVFGADGGVADGPYVSMRLKSARAAFPLVTATDDKGEPYLYALGGFDEHGGNLYSNSALSSVEMVPLDVFGDPDDGCFNDCHLRELEASPIGAATAEPRAGLQAIVRTVPGDTSYIFVIGGQRVDGTALASVERAQVLKQSDAPVLEPISAVDGTLASGTFYYRIAAVMSGADPRNPGGETLPSQEQPLSLRVPGGASLSFGCISGASSYRVYRTSSPNEPSGSELLLSELAAPEDCPLNGSKRLSFVDTGGQVSTARAPLPHGALGKWVSVGSLQQARAHASALLYRDTIYVSGGSSGASIFNTVERAQFAPDSMDLGSFETLSTTMSSPRRRHSMSIVDAAAAPAGFASASGNADDAWLMIVGGDSGTALVTSSIVEVMKVRDSAGPIASPSFANASYSVLPLHGGWSRVVGNRLFAIGDDGSGQTSNTIHASTALVCEQNSAPAPCATAASFLGGVTELLGFQYQWTAGSRFGGGATWFRGTLYLAGGKQNDDALAPTDRIQRLIF